MGNFFGSEDKTETEIPNENDYFNPQDVEKTEWKWNPIKFNSKDSKFAYVPPPKETFSIDQLSIVTYNVWFDGYKKKERAVALMDLCKDKDIICLQEVTPSFLEDILKIDWVRNNYFISDVQARTVLPYGVLILSKIQPLKFTFHKMESKMARYFLLMHLNVNNENIEIGTVHLESLSNRDRRKAQLELISKTLKCETSLFMGDFNFCSYRNWNKSDTNLENDVLKQIIPDHKDIWAELKTEKGYTFDSDVNRMIGKHETMRYDRIMIKSKTWIPETIDIIGNKSFVHEEERIIFPSDHFGLLTTINFNKNKNNI